MQFTLKPWHAHLVPWLLMLGQLQSSWLADISAGKLCGKLLSLGAPIAGSVKVRLLHATRPKKGFHFKAEADAPF